MPIEETGRFSIVDPWSGATFIIPRKVEKRLKAAKTAGEVAYIISEESDYIVEKCRLEDIGLACTDAAHLMGRALEWVGIPHEVVTGENDFGMIHQWVRVKGVNYDPTDQGYGTGKYVIEEVFDGKERHWTGLDIADEDELDAAIEEQRQASGLEGKLAYRGPLASANPSKVKMVSRRVVAHLTPNPEAFREPIRSLHQSPRASSMEGIGLSVTYDDEEILDAWRYIAELPYKHVRLCGVDGKTGKFVLWSAALEKQATEWAVANGWLEETAGWEVSWYDSEVDERRYTVYLTSKEAYKEMEYGGHEGEEPEVREIPWWTPTGSLIARWREHFAAFGPESIMDPSSAVIEVQNLYVAAAYPDADGIWWENVLDPYGLSAPRGVILPHALSRWAACRGRARKNPEPRQTRLYAALEPQGYRHFYLSPGQVRMCYDPRRPPLSIDEVLVVEDPDGIYWAWWDAEDQKFGMVQPVRAAVEIGFPYGSKAEEERGRGKLLQVRVETLKADVGAEANPDVEFDVEVDEALSPNDTSDVSVLALDLDDFYGHAVFGSKKAVEDHLREHEFLLGESAWYRGIRAKKVGYITGLVVPEEFRRHGYGSKIVEMILNEMRKRGVKTVILHAAPSRNISQAALVSFYERLGFEVIEQEYFPVMLADLKSGTNPAGVPQPSLLVERVPRQVGPFFGLVLQQFDKQGRILRPPPPGPTARVVRPTRRGMDLTNLTETRDAHVRILDDAISVDVFDSTVEDHDDAHLESEEFSNTDEGAMEATEFLRSFAFDVKVVSRTKENPSRRNLSLIRKYGGQVMPLKDLPRPAQLAIEEYLGEGEDERFGYVEIPMRALAAEIMKDAWNKVHGEFATFDQYHAWYVSGGDVPKYKRTARWPVLLSDDDDETLQDGWHRLHDYYRQGARTVPAVYFVGAKEENPVSYDHHVAQVNPDTWEPDPAIVQPLSALWDSRLTYLPIEQLRLLEHQPKPRIVRRLVRALKETPGQVPPIAVAYDDGSYDILDGHHRVEAARKLGFSRVPALVKGSAGRTGENPDEDKWDFGEYKLHPIWISRDMPGQKVMVGDVLFRGTSSAALTSEGLLAHTTWRRDMKRGRVYMTEYEAEAASYAALEVEHTGGEPLLCTITLDESLFKALKPGHEAWGEWYLEGELVPRELVDCRVLTPEALQSYGVESLSNPRQRLSVVKRPVYHGSDVRFEKFIRHPGKRYILFSEFDVESPSFFFAPTAAEAAEYGRYVSEWRIDVGRPFLNAETEEGLDVDLLDSQRLQELAYVLEPMVKKEELPFIDLGVRRHHVDLEDEEWPMVAVGSGGLVWDVLDCAACVQRLIEIGYDGTTVHEPDSESGYSWAIFSPDQAVKLTDVEEIEENPTTLQRLYHGTLAKHVKSIRQRGIEVGEGWGGAGTSGVFLSGSPEGALY